MRLRIVGCSGSVPGPASTASCYLVQVDGFSLVLDLGNGSLGPLQTVLRLSEIDAIWLSHLHPDHCLDMTALAVALRHSGVRLPAPIPVLADAAAPSRLASAMWPGQPASALAGLFSFTTEADTLGPLQVRTTPVNHPVRTRAIRLQHDGASLVYSGDTGACTDLIELARGADVLLCEAGWGGAAPGCADLHLTGAQAGEHAAEAGVGRLLLTHVPPWESVQAAVAGAHSTFDGPVDAVRAGDVFDVFSGVVPAG